MLKALRIENFRCFQTFELQQLGRLNLLVGTNNSGKTSILEAIQLLKNQLNLEALREIMLDRGEYIFSDETRKGRELDIRHLFYGHEVDLGSQFSILGTTDGKPEGISISIERSAQMSLFKDLREFVLQIQCLEKERIELQLFLKESFPSLPSDSLRRMTRDIKYSGVKTQFVTCSSLKTRKMFELFDQIVLAPEEELVIQALEIIEPNIERIASTRSEQYGGFIVKLANRDQRIPISSMGDGIRRMLGLTLAIVHARNSVLLVDEIDTGFHFSTMSTMWKLIWETAKRLNVQVFATTHNSDCWTSLAAIANAENPSEEGITIHRIEKGKTSSVLFTERQIAIAAERGIEVR